MDDEVLAYGQLAVEVGLLGHDAEHRLDPPALPDAIQAQHPELARRRSRPGRRSSSSSWSCRRRSAPGTRSRLRRGRRSRSRPRPGARHSASRADERSRPLPQPGQRCSRGQDDEGEQVVGGVDRHRRIDRSGLLVDPGEREAEEGELGDDPDAARAGVVEDPEDRGRDQGRGREGEPPAKSAEDEAPEEDLLRDRGRDDDQQCRGDGAPAAVAEAEVAGDVLLLRVGEARVDGRGDDVGEVGDRRGDEGADGRAERRIKPERRPLRGAAAPSRTAARCHVENPR